MAGVVAEGLWSEVPRPPRTVAAARQALLVVGALMSSWAPDLCVCLGHIPGGRHQL